MGPTSAYFSLVNRALLVLIGAWLFSTSLAQSVPPSDQAARETAVRWLALLDSGAFKQAYSERAPRINAYGHEDEFLSWMRARRAPFGRPKSRAFFRVTHSHTLLGAPDGNYEFMIFKTSFEHKAQAAEAVTLTSETGRWQVSGYSMR